jgi:hypothetical protein
MPLRFRAPLVAAAIAIAAAGCSSSGHQPQVAALPTSTASGGSPSTSGSASVASGSRPRERLDESTSQLEALDAPWNQCLDAHGGGKSDRPTQAIETAAQAACAHLEPLPPWQYDPSNPQAMGFVQRVVACLHQHGVQYAQVENPPGQGRIEIALGGPQNDQASTSEGLQLIPTCDQQVLRENASSTSP